MLGKLPPLPTFATKMPSTAAGLGEAEGVDGAPDGEAVILGDEAGDAVGAEAGDDEGPAELTGDAVAGARPTTTVFDPHAVAVTSIADTKTQRPTKKIRTMSVLQFQAPRG
jgi:hypothetical protein